MHAREGEGKETQAAPTLEADPKGPEPIPSGGTFPGPQPLQLAFLENCQDEEKRSYALTSTRGEAPLGRVVSNSPQCGGEHGSRRQVPAVSQEQVIAENDEQNQSCMSNLGNDNHDGNLGNQNHFGNHDGNLSWNQNLEAQSSNLVVGQSGTLEEMETLGGESETPPHVWLV